MIKKTIDLFNNKKGEVTGLSLTLKILISCIAGALLLSFFYGIIENYYVDNVIDNQKEIYASSASNFNLDTTYSSEIEHTTAYEN